MKLMMYLFGLVTLLTSTGCVIRERGGVYDGYYRGYGYGYRYDRDHDRWDHDHYYHYYRY
jgi:hypothetical protein